MRFPALCLALLTLASCTCGGPTVSGRYGELVVVQVSPAGRELLLREATVTVPPAFMGTTADFEVPVRNVGLEDVSVVSVTRLEGDEALTLDGSQGLSVVSQADGVLVGRFSPRQAADATTREVPLRAKFELEVSGTRAGEEKLVLELVATAVARDCYVPARIDFGVVPLQRAVTFPLALENGGPLPASTTFGALSGADASAFFVDGASPLTVPAGGRVELGFRFSPLEARPYAARLSMQRDAQCPAAEVELVGEGSDAALTWTPTRLDFGRIPLQLSSTKTVTVFNGSRVPLSLTGRVDSPDFVLEPGAPDVVPAQGSATVRVSCKPLTLGPRAGVLTLDLGTTPITPARIDLTCSGGGPRVRVDPAPLNFGLVPFRTNGGLVTKRRLLVQNVGTAPPAPGDTTNNLVLGRGGALPWFAIVPRNGLTRIEEFDVRLHQGYDPAVGLPAIAGQNFAEFEVSIEPRSSGLREADLLVYSNDSLEPVARVALTAGPRNPDLCSVRVEPEGVDFGSTPRGAVLVRAVTVTNIGPANGPACLVSGIDLAPGTNVAFQLTDPPLSSLLIPGQQSRAMVVQAVVPSDATVGDYLRGTLRFSVSGESVPRQLPIDLRVSRCLVVDPPLLDLGLVQEQCTSASKPVTLYNVCALPITLTNVSTPAAPFRVVSSPVSGAPVVIDPGSQVSALVAMRPTAPGSFSDALRFDIIEAGLPQSEAVGLRGTADAVGVQRETFTQGAEEVDILLVIDDSCSMADEQNSLASNFMAFMSAASSGSASWRIGVTTTDTFSVRGLLVRTSNNPYFLTPATPNVAALFADKVRVGVSGSGYEQPLAAAVMAVTEPNLSGGNAGFLRRDAMLSVVIVTDAAEQSPNSLGSYLTALRGAKQNRHELVSVSVVGPFSPNSSMCSTEGGVDVTRYESLVSQTNGVRADICTMNWGMDLESISRNLFARRRAFELSGQARSSADVIVRVNGMVQSSGWSYSVSSNTVTFSSPPPAGATIEIEYRTACF